MGFHHLPKSFARIGARLRISSAAAVEPGRVRLTVLKDDEGEFFDLAVNPAAPPEVSVVNIEPKARHLLLLIRNADGRKTKLLVGKDEAHFFVAGLPRLAPVGSVRQAMEYLKPDEVRVRQVGLSDKVRNWRKNPAFRRQGEWFLIPAPDFEPDPLAILRREPISRGRGNKPHVAEYAYRIAGTPVYVCNRYPWGLTSEEYEQFVQTEKGSKALGWRVMVRDAAVYVKGRLTHPDHRPVFLDGWHRLLPNTEPSSMMRQIGFLD
jgi:hypothetical protein